MKIPFVPDNEHGISHPVTYLLATPNLHNFTCRFSNFLDFESPISKRNAQYNLDYRVSSIFIDFGVSLWLNKDLHLGGSGKFKSLLLQMPNWVICESRIGSSFGKFTLKALVSWILLVVFRIALAFFSKLQNQGFPYWSLDFSCKRL